MRPLYYRQLLHPRVYGGAINFSCIQDPTRRQSRLELAQLAVDLVSSCSNWPTRSAPAGALFVPPADRQAEVVQGLERDRGEVANPAHQNGPLQFPASSSIRIPADII
jgi:hypothetical protein